MNSQVEIEQTDPDEVQIQAVIEKLKENPLIKRGLDEQAERSPQNLRYHDLKVHPEDVLHEVVLFVLKEGIRDERFLELRAIEAVYHDWGFLKQYGKNEGIGAREAKRVMRESGRYSEDEIREAGENIEDTEVDMIDGILTQRTPRNESGKYLLDADVSNLGRKDFFEKSQLLLQELRLQNSDNPPLEDPFLKTTFGFIKNHRWLTKAAQESRRDQQDINIRNLGQQLGIAA